MAIWSIYKSLLIYLSGVATVRWQLLCVMIFVKRMDNLDQKQQILLESWKKNIWSSLCVDYVLQFLADLVFIFTVWNPTNAMTQTPIVSHGFSLLVSTKLHLYSDIW